MIEECTSMGQLAEERDNVKCSAPKLTIALPVHNGEKTLDACLHAILEQTYRNLELVIFDNASTDRTREIALEAVRLDSRVTYRRHATNVGAAENFMAALASADTEYFAWRADDDLSSSNYFECLVSALEHKEDAALAIGNVESRITEKNKVKTISFVENLPMPRVVNVLRKMFLCHPSWIYGVWRTDKLRLYYSSRWEQYPILWANDHLVLFGVFLDDVMTGDGRATFVQRTGLRNGLSGRASGVRDYSKEIAFRKMALSRFRTVCVRETKERRWNCIERFLLMMFIDVYARRRVVATRKKLMSLRRKMILLKLRQVLLRM